MTEYIEREVALAKRMSAGLCDASGNEYGCAEFVLTDDIEAIPAADVVPVVRCCECKYRAEDDFCTGRGWPEQIVADDGYCDKGKRKDGDGEC